MENTLIPINELNLIENIDILFANTIILYGAGDEGKKAYIKLKILGIPVAYFCESVTAKCGRSIFGVEVISLSKLKELDTREDITVIITSYYTKYIEEILGSISQIQIRTDKIFTAIGLNLSLIQNIMDARISEQNRDLFLNIYSMGQLEQKIAGFSNEEKLPPISRCAELASLGIDSILVYQSRKVGSSSVSYSLSLADIENMQIHFLNFSSLKTEKYNEETRQAIMNHISGCTNIIRNSQRIKIITIVREPISRVVSWATFLIYKCYYHYPHYISPGESFIESFLNIISTSIQDQFNWFHDELEDVFGIDVYAHPFNKDKGYSIIKQDNIEVLVMKTEKLNCLEGVIGEFVGAPNFKLINVNEADSLPIKYIYKNIKDTIKIPYETIAQCYEGNPMMDHFYSLNEKKELLKKWEKNIVR